MKKYISTFLVLFTSTLLTVGCSKDIQREYLHTDHKAEKRISRIFNTNPNFSEYSEEKIISLGDKELIVLQKGSPKGDPFVVIPGYVSQLYSRTENNRRFSDVNIITDPDEKKKIEEIVREYDFKGPINFW